MCGILGFIKTPWNKSIKGALKPLYCRGPDKQSYWSDTKDRVVFGHTRLSVIDINGGCQPMTSEDGRFVLVFNGELYNFQSLRKELEKCGFSFQTSSDTEVVLKAFMHWSEKVTLFMDGMFAFAVWDTVTKKLFCARDRVGIKPFFYYFDNGFLFSSSLKSFLSIPNFPKEIDPKALRDFLAFQTCLAPDSFLKKVRQLPPSSQLTWDANTKLLHIKKYWLPSPIDEKIDRHEVIDEVGRLLKKSVKNQMISDVPLGAFLSGGIDSSLMVRYMCEAGAKSVDTFTLKFLQDGYDESNYAKKVADYFGCNNHILESGDINGNTWASIVSMLDQPLADPAYIVTSSLSQLTKQQVTVSISGDGGDELFAGYARLGVTPDSFPEKFLHNRIRKLVESGWLPPSLIRRTLHGSERIFYNRVELGPWKKGRKNMRQFINQDFQKDMDINQTMNLWRGLAKDMSVKDLMDADLWTYLSENCLTKTDRASMSYGLEIRVPMLSNDMLDFSTSIPVQHHFDDMGGKRILRKLAQEGLPESTWNRKKHGFSVPLQDFFNGAWNAKISELVDSCSDIAPFLEEKYVRQLWLDSKDKKSSRRLAYTFAVLLQWLSSNNL